jgi:NitT/TauT family transport system substrate-binding protein
MDAVSATVIQCAAAPTHVIAAFCFGFAALAFPQRVTAEELVVSLWGTSMIGVPYAVAMEKGYFRQAGISITGIVGGSGGGNVVRAVLANPLPYGEVATPAAIAARQQGLPIVAVNGGVLAADNAWVTLPSSKLTAIKDLVGKRVAYTTPKSISEAFLRTVLKVSGIDPQSLTLVAAGGVGEGLTMLDNGGVDAALTVEPIHTIRKGKYKDLFAVKDILPPVLSNIGITTLEFAARHPETIRAIIEGRRKGVEFVYAHPEEAGRIFAHAYHMPQEICVEAVEAMVKARYWVAGEFDVTLLNNLADDLRVTGALVGDVDWTRLMDTSMLPPDLRSKGSH